MKFSLGLPWGGRWEKGSLVSGAELADLAREAEESGYAAVFATDHPAPPRQWLAKGGHPTLDPFVGLSFVAAATTTLGLHTHLLIAAYRHPLLTAKAVASLALLSGGRVILGVGAGYLEGEFAALDVPFGERNALTDEALVTLRRALKGEEVDGAVIRPLPKDQPRIPLWVGGNSRRAIERAVSLAQGWCPMPSPEGSAALLRTPGIESLNDLAGRIAFARERAAELGRSEPLTICFAPQWGAMSPSTMPDPVTLRERCGRLGELGVSWVTVNLPGASREELAENIRIFGEQVVGPES